MPIEIKNPDLGGTREGDFKPEEYYTLIKGRGPEPPTDGGGGGGSGDQGPYDFHEPTGCLIPLTYPMMVGLSVGLKLIYPSNPILGIASLEGLLALSLVSSNSSVVHFTGSNESRDSSSSVLLASFWQRTAAFLRELYRSVV